MDPSKGRNQPIVPYNERINSHLSRNSAHHVEPCANSTLRVDEEKKVIYSGPTLRLHTVFKNIFRK